MGISNNSNFDIAIINGPNLNLLGLREPEIYGKLTLEMLNKEIREYAGNKGLKLKFFQSNHEGAIIDFIQEVYMKISGLIINPAAFTHYSIAIRDAIAATAVPTVEVHLSDISTREAFRHTSLIADVCIGQIYGLGKESYLRGLDLLIKHNAV